MCIRDRVEVGQTVEITCDSLEEMGTIEGVVTKVSVAGTTSNGVTTYPVTVQIDNPPEDLLPGMNVDATIVVDEAENAVAVPISAVQRGKDVYKRQGYRSLHLILEVPIFLSECTKPVRIELQLRTIAMDFWASLEHQLRYKADVEVPPHISDDLKACADVIAATDEEMQRIAKELNVL